MYDGGQIWQHVMTRTGLPSGARPRAGRVWLLLALLTLTLDGGLTATGAGRLTCARDGDWLVCSDGRRYAIRLDADAEARGPRWRPRPGDRLDGPRETPTTGGPLIETSDGLTCWLHGDHVHCR
jgi:hypothetical protein